VIDRSLAPEDGPAIPPDALGSATVSAALLVDRLAVQLLGACGPFDPAPERLARVRQVLAAWSAVELAVQELAAVAGVEPVDLVAANDQARQELAA